MILTMIFFEINNWDHSGLFKGMNEPIEILVIYIMIIVFGFLVFRDLKIAKFKIKDFIPDLKISWRFIGKIAIIYTAFSISLNRLINYSFSLIFPDYIETIINKGNSQNLVIFLTEFLLAMLILLPVLNLLFEGILLQKMSLKWGNKKAILGILLIFFVLSLFSFTPSSIIGLLYMLILSILFFKTANLLNIFVFDIIVNVISNILGFIFYAQNFNFPYISIVKYREIHEPFLIIYLILSVISCIFLVKFIRNNFPKENDTIPYLKNREKLLN
jgi:uncharacterized protein